MDGFEAVIPANSLTGTLPADLNFGIIDPALAPEHPGLAGFANVYGLSAEDVEVLPGQHILVRIPVYQADLDAAGEKRIEDLNVYQWNSDTREWTQLEITEREDTNLAQPIGFVTVKVTYLGKLNYFTFGVPIFNPGNGSDCFIATAVYGTKMATEVVALRRFRDNRLMKNTAGRAFVKWYYRHSPPVADFIRHRSVIKATVRVGLKPIFWISGLFR